MIKEFFQMAAYGWAKKLALNPRKISILLCLLDQNRPHKKRWNIHKLASIDAIAVASALREPADARFLEIHLGNTTQFRISLGPKE